MWWLRKLGRLLPIAVLEFFLLIWRKLRRPSRSDSASTTSNDTDASFDPNPRFSLIGTRITTGPLLEGGPEELADAKFRERLDWQIHSIAEESNDAELTSLLECAQLFRSVEAPAAADGFWQPIDGPTDPVFQFLLFLPFLKPSNVGVDTNGSATEASVDQPLQWVPAAVLFHFAHAPLVDDAYIDRLEAWLMEILPVLIEHPDQGVRQQIANTLSLLPHRHRGTIADAVRHKWCDFPAEIEEDALSYCLAHGLSLHDPYTPAPCESSWEGRRRSLSSLMQEANALVARRGWRKRSMSAVMCDQILALANWDAFRQRGHWEAACRELAPLKEWFANQLHDQSERVRFAATLVLIGIDPAYAARVLLPLVSLNTMPAATVVRAFSLLRCDAPNLPPDERALFMAMVLAATEGGADFFSAVQLISSVQPPACEMFDLLVKTIEAHEKFIKAAGGAALRLLEKLLVPMLVSTDEGDGYRRRLRTVLQWLDDQDDTKRELAHRILKGAAGEMATLPYSASEFEDAVEWGVRTGLIAPIHCFRPDNHPGAFNGSEPISLDLNVSVRSRSTDRHPPDFYLAPPNAQLLVSDSSRIRLYESLMGTCTTDLSWSMSSKQAEICRCVLDELVQQKPGKMNLPVTLECLLQANLKAETTTDDLINRRIFWAVREVDSPLAVYSLEKAKSQLGPLTHYGMFPVAGPCTSPAELARADRLWLAKGLVFDEGACTDYLSKKAENFTLDGSDGDDLLQDFFLFLATSERPSLVTVLSQMRDEILAGESSFDNFLRFVQRTFTNWLHDRFRKRRRKRATKLVFDGDMGSWASENEFSSRLPNNLSRRAELDELAPLELFVLFHDKGGLTWREISDRLGKSETQVKYLGKKAIAKASTIPFDTKAS